MYVRVQELRSSTNKERLWMVVVMGLKTCIRIRVFYLGRKISRFSLQKLLLSIPPHGESGTEYIMDQITGHYKF